MCACVCRMCVCVCVCVCVEVHVIGVSLCVYVHNVCLWVNYDVCLRVCTVYVCAYCVHG